MSLILHLVTNRQRLCGADAPYDEARSCLLEQIREAVAAGIDVVQIREGDLEGGRLAGLVADAVSLARGTQTRVLVNDRLDVALAAGAAGVHLRADSMPPGAVRRIAPAGFLVGRSVHSLPETRDALDGVDYVIAGTIWPTASKPAGHPSLGVAGLTAIAAALRVPTLAIGGVSMARMGEVALTGAAGVAAIGLFMAPHPAPGIGRCRAQSLVQTAAEARSVFDSGRTAS